MRTTVVAAALAILIMSADEARACGHRRACGLGHRRAAVIQPYAYSHIPQVPTPAPAVETPTLAHSAAVRGPEAPPEGGALPLFRYEPNSQDGKAYYYTYDEAGKLVVRQWMDWLFRGGRRAGMPAPPLPIVGRLRD